MGLNCNAMPAAMAENIPHCVFMVSQQSEVVLTIWYGMTWNVYALRGNLPLRRRLLLL